MCRVACDNVGPQSPPAAVVTRWVWGGGGGGGVAGNRSPSTSGESDPGDGDRALGLEKPAASWPEGWPGAPPGVGHITPLGLKPT